MCFAFQTKRISKRGDAGSKEGQENVQPDGDWIDVRLKTMDDQMRDLVERLEQNKRANEALQEQVTKLQGERKEEAEHKERGSGKERRPPRRMWQWLTGVKGEARKEEAREASKR